MAMRIGVFRFFERDSHLFRVWGVGVVVFVIRCRGVALESGVYGLRMLRSKVSDYGAEGLPIGSLVVPFWDYLIGF